LLGIDNRFGSIDIAIGESNRIKMDIWISVKSSSTKKAQETLDRIQIQFEEGTNQVKARTEIESSSGWTTWFQTGNVEMKINYQVLVPADIYLELINKYGSIYVESTKKDLRIDLGYGDIRLGDINSKLFLKMSYSDGVLSGIQDGDMTLSYSNLEMKDAPSINLDMKYSDLIMGSATRMKLVSSFSDLQGQDIDELHYSGKYDDLVIERVKIINAESAYSGMEIGTLHQSGNFDLRYGNLEIGHISPGFSRLNVNTSFTNVELDFAPETSFTLDAQTSYCSISQRGLKVMEDIRKGSEVTLKAAKGTGGGQVVARMKYGELTIE
jgi:hypothetical protein